MIPAALTRSEDLPTATHSRTAAKATLYVPSFADCPLAGLFFVLRYRLTRKRFKQFLHRWLLVLFICLQLVPDVFLYRLFVPSHRIYIVSPAPELPAPISLLHYRGDSGHASASMISTPLRSLNVLSIFPTSTLIFPQITYRRYFGANTIWYLQFHVVYARLFLSIPLSSCYFVFGWQTACIIALAVMNGLISLSFPDPLIRSEGFVMQK